ncbi:hypothetical protein AB0M54_45890 [Actinoplanes sp. NPDC051470]|uniref:hypothetical protein n=1 Tax=Actinoplanes sp. NPDC051470 TaxID=3157224 RepID=UPI00344A5FEB
MKTAKGLAGIRNFVATDAKKAGWHVFLTDTYVGYVADKNVFEIAKDRGATLLGWTGNGVTFDR